MRTYLLCVLCVSIIVGVCADDEEKKEPVEMPKEVVTERREVGFTNRLERDLRLRPRTESVGLETATSVVGRVEIEKTDAFSIVDAMKYTPGAWTERRGRKVKEFFSVRGQRYPYPSYTVDGAWFREFHETNYFFNAANVDRIEIIRSSASLLYSPGGMAGVINIEPRHYDGPSTEFEMLYGSMNTFRSQLSHGNGNEEFDYALGLGYYHTDGPDDENAREKINNFYNHISMKAGDDWRFSLTSFALYGDRELQLAEPPASNTLQTREDSFDPMKIYGFVFKGEYEPNDDVGTEILLNYANRRFWGRRAPDTEWLEEDYEYGVNFLQRVKLAEENTLRAGLMTNYWRSPTGKRFYVGRPGELITYSGVLVDEHEFDNLTIDLGARVSRTYIEEFGGFNVEGSPKGLTSVHVENEWEDPLYTLSFGSAYSITSALKLHSNLSWGQIAAKPGMLNADLQTPPNESRTKADAGFSLISNNHGEATLTGFYVYQDDAALTTSSTVTVDGEDFALYETGDRKSYGVELDLKSVRANCGVQAFTNAVAMRTHRMDSGNWTLDKEAPEYIVNGGLSYLIGPVEFLAYAHHVSRYENERYLPGGSDPAPLGDFVEVNMKVVYSFGADERNQVFIGVDNIGDKEYSTVAGYPDEGRVYKVGFRYRF